MVESGAGNGTWFSKGTDRHPVWHVNWRTGELTVTGEVPEQATMKTVDGEILQDNEAKRFRADRAIADKKSNILTLTGHVSIYSPKRGANLRCDKLVYSADEKLFRASGNVSFLSKNTTIVGIPAAFAASDFSQVASPDMYKESHATKP